MKQYDKELLFKDLCARLPYHVKCKIWLEDGTTEEGLLDLQHNYGNVLQDAFYYNKIKDIKPYLRPMSSMTEEEIKECYQLQRDTIHVTFCKYDEGYEKTIDLPYFESLVDFYNSHHLDYRGLIEKGLALEAPKDMYKVV